MQELTRRQKILLRCVIRNFIETATPVGSEHLVKRYHLAYSSATVRNDMMALEKMGYLEQPYASSGRVPSDLGYRAYVTRLMRKEMLRHEDRIRIDEGIQQAHGNLRRILSEASQILGTISNELGVVLTPWMCNWVFDRIEFIALSDNKVLAVIRVQSRQAKTVILEIASTLKQEELNQTAEILNERLNGLRLEEIRNSIGLRIQDVSGGHPDLIRKMVDAARDLFNFSEPLDVHTSGTQNMLMQPEFSNQQMMQHVLALVEERQDLLEIMQDHCPRPRVSIGRENPNERFQAFSVVKATYTVGQEEGTIGVIGPTRMPYRRIVPLVEHMAEAMSAHLGQ